MIADVDAPSIVTAGESGARFRYQTIPTLLLLIVPLFFIHDVAGRVGLATREELAAAIWDNYSKKCSERKYREDAHQYPVLHLKTSNSTFKFTCGVFLIPAGLKLKD